LTVHQLFRRATDRCLAEVLSEGTRLDSTWSRQATRFYAGLALVGVLLVAAADGQRIRVADGRDLASARAVETVQSLRRNLKDSRHLLDRINDKDLRQQLESILARAALDADDLEELLIGAPRRRSVRPISDADFGNLLRNIKDRSFDKDKLEFIAVFLKDRPINCSQATRILKTLSFDEGRVEAAIAMYPNIVDSKNFYDVLNVFAFESKRKQVMDAVKKLRPR
jgi:hypothetical protein